MNKPKQRLVDVMWLTPKLTESEDGPSVLEGVFQRADTKNANGRTYPRALFEKIFADGSPAMERLNSRAMLGLLEHPEDGKTNIRKTSHIVTKLSMNEDGEVLGRLELLDTPDGKIAQELARKGVRLGISSRGAGTVNASGVVEEYDLETFDIVWNPSTGGAFLTPVMEGMEDKETKMTVQEFPILESTARTLLSQDIEGLAAYQLRDISERLLQSSMAMTEAATSVPGVADTARSLSLKLVEKREQVQQALEAPAPIAENDTDDSDEDEDTGTLAEQAENYRKLLVEARDALVENEKRLTAAYDLVEEMTSRLAQQDGGELMEAAKEIVVALQERHLSQTVEEAVEACVKEHPVLAESVELFGGCKTLEDVEARRNKLVKLHEGAATITEDEQRSLPVGRARLNESQDDSDGEPSKSKKGTSSLTEAELARMSRSARLAQQLIL